MITKRQIKARAKQIKSTQKLDVIGKRLPTAQICYLSKLGIGSVCHENERNNIFYFLIQNNIRIQN